MHSYASLVALVWAVLLASHGSSAFAPPTTRPRAAFGVVRASNRPWTTAPRMVCDGGVGFGGVGATAISALDSMGMMLADVTPEQTAAAVAELPPPYVRSGVWAGGGGAA